MPLSPIMLQQQLVRTDCVPAHSRGEAGDRFVTGWVLEGLPWHQVQQRADPGNLPARGVIELELTSELDGFVVIPATRFETYISHCFGGACRRVQGTTSRAFRRCWHWHVRSQSGPIVRIEVRLSEGIANKRITDGRAITPSSRVPNQVAPGRRTSARTRRTRDADHFGGDLSASAEVAPVGSKGRLGGLVGHGVRAVIDGRASHRQAR